MGCTGINLYWFLLFRVVPHLKADFWQQLALRRPPAPRARPWLPPPAPAQLARSAPRTWPEQATATVACVLCCADTSLLLFY